jgi:hypothetical protein
MPGLRTIGAGDIRSIFFVELNRAGRRYLVLGRIFNFEMC